MLAGAYFDRTADRPFLEKLWPHIQRALKWIDEFGDVDGDGFSSMPAIRKMDWCSKAGRIRTIRYSTLTAKSRNRRSLFAKCKAMSMPRSLPPPA